MKSIKKPDSNELKMHGDKTQNLWENVLWTDKTKLELFSKKHCLCTWEEMKLSKKRTPYLL